MEKIIDKLIEEITLLNQTDSANGGIADVLPLNAIYFGDPGIIPASLYPCVTVSPDFTSPDGGTTGYDNTNHRIEISVLIDARQYFDSTVDEAQGDRLIVQAITAINRWFQTRRNRTLDGTVQKLSIEATQYRKRERGQVFAREAGTTFVVRKTYARVID